VRQPSACPQACERLQLAAVQQGSYQDVKLSTAALFNIVSSVSRHGATGLQCEEPRPHALCMGPRAADHCAVFGKLAGSAPEPSGSSFCDDVQQQNARLCRRKVSERSHMCRSAESETTSSVQFCRQLVVMLQLCMAQTAAWLIQVILDT
jgi:hypothetical protein